MAERPGEKHSYTNNFPYDPSVGNTPIPGALLWSALSLMVLLAGIAAVLLAFGKFDYLGWISRGHASARTCCRAQSSPGQRALVKFFVVVALLLLVQTLVGGAAAHYRADPGSFYGFQLETHLPQQPAAHLAPADARSSGSPPPTSPPRCFWAARCAATSRAGLRAGRICCSPRSWW